MKLFPGSLAFRMKDEKGLPLSQVIGGCIANNRTIEWVSFIEAARASGWYDFQTYSALVTGLTDADTDEDYRLGVIQRFKLYVLANPHPCLK